MDDTPNAVADSRFSSVSTAQKTILSFVLELAYASKIGLKRMQGGQRVDQKSMMTPG